MLLLLLLSMSLSLFAGIEETPRQFRNFKASVDKLCKEASCGDLVSSAAYSAFIDMVCRKPLTELSTEVKSKLIEARLGTCYKSSFRVYPEALEWGISRFRIDDRLKKV